MSTLVPMQTDRQTDCDDQTFLFSRFLAFLSITAIAMDIGSIPSEDKVFWRATGPWSGWLLAFFLGGMVATLINTWVTKYKDACVKALDTDECMKR